MRAALLLVALVGACAPCGTMNHSGVCEGPAITPAEQAEAAEIARELRARADTSTTIHIGG